jgi:hypothetical protein
MISTGFPFQWSRPLPSIPRSPDSSIEISRTPAGHFVLSISVIGILRNSLLLAPLFCASAAYPALN